MTKPDTDFTPTRKLDTLSTTMPKQEYLHIRIDSDNKRAIENAARAQGRTVSNYLIWVESEYRKQAILDGLYKELPRPELPDMSDVVNMPKDRIHKRLHNEVNRRNEAHSEQTDEPR